MKQNVPLSSIDDCSRRFAGMAVVGRLANLIKDARLDCECRSRLDETLARFTALEVRRAAREHLANARCQRERIEAILFFLQDLDEMGAAERDRSVYMDLALLLTTSRAPQRRVHFRCGNSVYLRCRRAIGDQRQELVKASGDPANLVPPIAVQNRARGHLRQGETQHISQRRNRTEEMHDANNRHGPLHRPGACGGNAFRHS